jgi:hypothetical protein
MSRSARPEIRARFRAVVARGLARAERELAEHLVSLRPGAALDARAERRRVHGLITAPPASRRPRGDS